MTATVACLAGDGVGPELMAAASRALERVAELHQLTLDDRHLPFAGEAVTRSGHPLPADTRAAYRDADAILVAAPHEPAFDGVKADFELSWRVARVQVAADHDLVVVGPVDEWANATAVGRALACAAARRGRITSVGSSPAWRDALATERATWDGLTVDEARLGDTLVALRDRPHSLDVIVTEAHLLDAIVDAAASLAGSRASVVHAWLPDDGPGIFAPASSEPDEHAGFGVADPKAMLLAASLMLGEGLQRRAASRTLERAVAAAARANGATRDTRAFTDAVIELLPQTRTDVDHFDEVWR
jgi:3-isopropylmalate dehydrogenase